MALTRSIGAYDDGTPEAPGIGTTPIDVRKSLSALWASAGVVSGGPSPLVVGMAGFAYQVNGPVPLVTTRGPSDGFAMFTNDGAATVTCPGAPGSGLQRIDILWVRHPTNTENSDTSSMPIFGVASGTAVSSGPAAPSIPTGALELARNTMTSAATSTASTGNTIAQTAAVAALRGASIDTFRNGDTVPLFGASPALTTPKIRQEFTTTATTNAGGAVNIPFPTPFPHGLTYLSAVPGDSIGDVGFFVPSGANYSLGAWNGVVYTVAGALARSALFRVNIVAVGW